MLALSRASFRASDSSVALRRLRFLNVFRLATWAGAGFVSAVVALQASLLEKCLVLPATQVEKAMKDSDLNA